MIRWECPSCGHRDVTEVPQPHTRMHACPAQKGLTVPLVETERELVGVRHVPVERDDYEGTERGLVHDGEGKSVTAIHTERPDGSYDTLVFAPVASVRAD